MAEIAAVDPAIIQAANALKDQGNAFLGQGKYKLAVEKYTEAIALHPTAIFYSNRAQALIKLEAYGQAIMDANEALKLDPKYIKAYYRRGSANYALGKLKQAVKDFKGVIAIVPKDPDASEKLKICEKMLRAEAFQKAIETDVPPESIVDLASIAIEGGYTGPHLQYDAEGKPVYTLEFAKECMEFMRQQKSIHRKYVLQVLISAIAYFKNLPTLIHVNLPRSETIDLAAMSLHDSTSVTGTFTVCGDTHGQYYDLLNIFELGGFPSFSNFYLFNGDYVDRGSFSFETVFALLLLKLALPQGLHMLRGNHETKNMNRLYGFCAEVKHKYDNNVMDVFSRVFQSLPLAACLEKKVFIVHGGLSTQEGGVTLDQIATIDRFREPPESGLMSDLLWSDPQPQPGRAPSKRGLGYSFGPDYTSNFLNNNKLRLVIRSHEVREQGYEEEHGGRCITVFSAPNYCDQMGNKGAFIRFSSAECEPEFTTFDAVPHPNIPPMAYAGNFMGI